MNIRSFLLSVAILIVVLLTISCLTPVKFDGMSMRPAISDGDRIIVTTNVGEIKRGDIIQFRYPKDPEKFYMKRVVGLPGETIEIVEGVTMINDAALEEGYVDSEYNQSRTNISKITIPSAHYFVMGDNRDNSSDSRYWGTVEKSLIEGKYYWKYASSDSY